MKEIKTNVEFDASKYGICKVLSDFEPFLNWSTFINNIKKVMKVGTKLDVNLETSIGSKISIKPEVMKADDLKEFRWLDHLTGVKFLFNGGHYFRLDRINEERTGFVQGERFTGILVPFLRRYLDTETKSV